MIRLLFVVALFGQAWPWHSQPPAPSTANGGQQQQQNAERQKNDPGITPPIGLAMANPNPTNSPPTRQPTENANSEGEQSAFDNAMTVASGLSNVVIGLLTIVLAVLAYREWKTNEAALKTTRIVERAWVSIKLVTVTLEEDNKGRPTLFGKAAVVLENHGRLPATNVLFTFTDTIAPESPSAPPDDKERTRTFASPVIAPNGTLTHTLPIVFSKRLEAPTFIKVFVQYKNGFEGGETRWCRVIFGENNLLPTRDYNDMT